MTDARMLSDATADAAASCHVAAVNIQRELAGLRTHLQGVEALRVAVATTRFQALMAGYDIYARMLDDALTDIASGLRGDHTDPRPNGQG